MTTETKDFPITLIGDDNHAAVQASVVANLTRRVSVATQEERMVAAHKLGIAHQEAGKAFNIASHNFATLGEVEAYEAGYLGAKKRSANFIRQAIVTKFLGPTNVRGSRVKATAAAGSVTLSWDHALNSDQNHHAAAQALATKLKWDGEWIGGGMPDNSGHCYVLADSASFTV